MKTGEKIRITGETNVKFWTNHWSKFQNSLILFPSRNNKDQYLDKMALKSLVCKSKIKNFLGLLAEPSKSPLHDCSSNTKMLSADSSLTRTPFHGSTGVRFHESLLYAFSSWKLEKTNQENIEKSIGRK